MMNCTPCDHTPHNSGRTGWSEDLGCAPHPTPSPPLPCAAGSAWQSDMTEHPNGSPGSANTSERRRRAEGEMAAQAGQVCVCVCVVCVWGGVCRRDSPSAFTAPELDAASLAVRERVASLNPWA